MFTLFTFPSLADQCEKLIFILHINRVLLRLLKYSGVEVMSPRSSLQPIDSVKTHREKLGV